MGLLLTCDETLPIPRRVTMTLECDTGCGYAETFNLGDYMCNMRVAKATGWIERIDCDRKFLCPRCSGK